ncbi:hypothetical protein HDU93_006181, partial [Gonapodya sp. JEL0774]
MQLASFKRSSKIPAELTERSWQLLIPSLLTEAEELRERQRLDLLRRKAAFDAIAERKRRELEERQNLLTTWRRETAERAQSTGDKSLAILAEWQIDDG